MLQSILSTCTSLVVPKLWPIWHCILVQLDEITKLRITNKTSFGKDIRPTKFSRVRQFYDDTLYVLEPGKNSYVLVNTSD